MSLLEPLRLAPLESLLPNGTSQLGPPVFLIYTNKTNYNKHSISSLIKQKLYAKAKAKRTKERKEWVTMTVESLAAMAKISAQETVWGHSFSKADLISSITSNPLAEFLFGFDLFSLASVPLLSNNIEPSQPWKF